MPNRQKSRHRPRAAFAFLLRVARGFLSNQGLLLAGTVTYYTLLSIVPFSILAPGDIESFH